MHWLPPRLLGYETCSLITIDCFITAGRCCGGWGQARFDDLLSETYSTWRYIVSALVRTVSGKFERANLAEVK